MALNCAIQQKLIDSELYLWVREKIMYINICIYGGLPWWLSGKESACNAGVTEDVGLIFGLGRSFGGEHGNLLQYSCLENPVDRGAWRATVHRVAKSWTWLKHAHTHVYMWNLEKWYWWAYLQGSSRERHRRREQTCGHSGEKGRVGCIQRVALTCVLSCVKQIASGKLLHSTGSSAQCSVMT